MKKLIFIAVMVAVAGCSSSSKPKPDPNVKYCPEATVRAIQENQRFFQQVEEGVTPADGLKKLKGLKRKATLEKDGETPMLLVFFQTGLPKCAWVPGEESLTPVAVRGGIIQRVGTRSVRDMAGEGWVIKEAVWPWQRYDFGYIPGK